ncbi:MAG: hypothetical protein ACOX9C_02415 [Kiritimatiellia bacterium]
MIKHMLMVGIVFAGFVLPAAVVTVSDPADLASPSPYVVGNGMLRYTGPSATVDNAFEMQAPSGAGATIDVENEDTTLTVGGAFTTTSGAFVKKGPGTLKLAAPDTTQQIGIHLPEKPDANVAVSWDPATGAISQGFGAYNVSEGRLVIGAPGQKNVFNGWGDIGNRSYQKNACLDVVGGEMAVTGGNAFNLCCGNGTIENDVGSWMTVEGGADVTLTATLRILYRQWLANGSAFWGRGHLLVKDGSRLKVTKGIVVQDAGVASLVVSNASYFANNVNDEGGRILSHGLVLGSGYIGGSSVFDTTHNSTSVLWAVEARQGHSVRVGPGARLEFARPGLGYASDRIKGDATIDGGTLSSISTLSFNSNPLPWAHWFTGMTNVFVGAQGATFHTRSGLSSVPPTSAVLGPRIAAAPGVAPGTIRKTGGGILSIQAMRHPIVVDEGTLRMASPETLWDKNFTGTVAFASGATLALAGNRSAAQMDVSSAQTIKLFPAGDEGVRGAWQANGWATAGGDGRLMLNGCSSSGDGLYQSYGSVNRLARVPVDRSFTVTFNVRREFIRNRPFNGGFAIAFHNSEAGPSAVGDWNSLFQGGFAGGSITNKACAMIVATPRDSEPNSGTGFVRFSSEGAISEVGAMTSNPQFRHFYDLSPDAPVGCRLAYNAATKQLTLTMTRPDSGASASFTHAADIASIVGGPDAYLAFTGCSVGNWRTAVTFVTDVRYVASGDASIDRLTRTGGVMALAPGASRAFLPDARFGREGYLMKSLVYGDQTTLAINPLNAGGGSPFFGFERYSGSGTLVKSGTAHLGLVNTNAQNVALRVDAGGLILRREELERPKGTMDWDWQINERGGEALVPLAGAHGGLRFGIPRRTPCNANSRRTVDISGSWRLSFDLHPHGINDDFTDNAMAGECIGFTINDNAAGEFFVGGGEGDKGGMDGCRNCLGGIVGIASDSGRNRQFLAVNNVGGFYRQSDYTTAQVQSGDRIRVEIAYDQPTQTVTYTLQHGDNEAVVCTEENVDAATRFPSGRARLSFSTMSGYYYHCTLEVANIAFERTDGGQVAYPAGTAYLASLTSGLASLPVVADLEIPAAVRLAESVALPANGSLNVTAPREAATVAMGSLAAADGRPALALGEHVTASVDTAADQAVLTVNGGVLKLTNTQALSSDGVLVLENDATLELAFDGCLKIAKIVRNGGGVASGHYDSSEAWIVGPGAIMSGRSIMVIVR